MDPLPHAAGAVALAMIFACASGSRVATAFPEAEDGDASGPEQLWTYEIRISEDLEHMELGLCIEGPQPESLVAARGAMAFVDDARVRAGPALARDGDRFEIETLADQGCVDLSIDLAAAAEASGRGATRRGDTAMISPTRWLWYPGEIPANFEARARFVLPEGMHATVPWPELGDGWRRLDRTTFGWSAWVGFGYYDPIEFVVGDCTFEVAILDGERRASDAGIEAWLRTAAEGSIQLYGHFPRERVAAVVIPTTGWGSSPVLFGMARRGGGGSVLLVLNTDAADDELPGEWVATHELLHLGMPPTDPWMSEGFVTYYTQILRARQGVLGRGGEDGPIDRDDQARRALVNLERGFRRARGGLLTLGFASDNMGRIGAYGRVYWGGAAVAFDLDRRLREASNNRRSLDDLMLVVEGLALGHRRWSADEIVERMDVEVSKWIEAGELEGEISVAEIVAKHLQAKSLADEIERLEGLAVELDSGEIRLRSSPDREVRLRSALFEARQP